MSGEVVRQLVATFAYKLDKASEAAVVASMKRVENAANAASNAVGKVGVGPGAPGGAGGAAGGGPGKGNALKSRLDARTAYQLRLMRGMEKIEEREERQRGSYRLRMMRKNFDREETEKRQQLQFRLRMMRNNFEREEKERRQQEGALNRASAARRGRLRRIQEDLNLGRRGVGLLSQSMQPLRTGALAGVAGVAGLGYSWFQSASQLEDVRADLQIVTGSAEKAALAMRFVTEFAVGSRSTIIEVAEAFAKLTSFGVDPTIERMTALNNVATAAGVNMSDLVEGAKNLSIGLPRVLERYIARFGYQLFIQQENKGGFKEGDIMAQLGDQPRFKIGRNTSDVIAWLVQLGQSARFAEAAAIKVNTLQGALDNLKDAWILLMGRVSEGGAAKKMMDILLRLTAFLRGDSGGLSTIMGDALNVFFDAIIRGLDYIESHPAEVQQFFKLLIESFKTLMQTTIKFMDFVVTNKAVLFFVLEHLGELMVAAFGAKGLSFLSDFGVGIANIVLMFRLFRAEAAAAALAAAGVGAGVGAGAGGAAAGVGAGAAAGAGASAFWPQVAAIIGLSAAVINTKRAMSGEDVIGQGFIDRLFGWTLPTVDSGPMQGWKVMFDRIPDDQIWNLTDTATPPPGMFNLEIGQINVQAPPDTADAEDFGRRVADAAFDKLGDSFRMMIARNNAAGA